MPRVVAATRRSTVLPLLACALAACRSGGVAAPADCPLTDVTASAGVAFVHATGATGRMLLPEIMAGGVALFDHDGDGDLDIYLTNGAARNRLFRQDEPLRFTDVTEASGLGDSGYGMGVAIGDYDNDGAPDVYVTNYGADRLYRNRGDGTFDDVTLAARIDVDGWSTSATFVDYDVDGDLDLYVARYVVYDPSKRCTDAAGRPDYCAPQVFPPAPDVLLENRGDGTFRDVSLAAGIRSRYGPGLGVVASDFDDDGVIDLFVANDGAANQLWVNLGDGSFREVALLAGLAYNVDGQAEASMGVVAEDLDGDGIVDLFVTHLANETHTFYRGRGSGAGYDDATGRSGLAASSLASTGFGAVAVDLVGDGRLDLVVATGRVTRGEPRERSDVAAPWDRFAEPNQVFLNRGGGRFEPLDRRCATVRTVEVSRGLAAGDLDGDGDRDLVVVNIGGAPRIYRNDAAGHGSWLAVRVEEPGRPRPAVGARITLLTETGGRTRHVRRGGSYLSSSSAVPYFALAPGAAVEGIVVRWPDGTEERFAVSSLDREILVRRGAGVPHR